MHHSIVRRPSRTCAAALGFLTLIGIGATVPPAVSAAAPVARTVTASPVMTPQLNDAFSRTATGGWGLIGGRRYSFKGVASPSVSSGLAWLRGLRGGAASEVTTYVWLRDLQVKTSFVVPTVSPSLSSIVSSVDVREQADGRSYRGSVTFVSTGRLILSVSRVSRDGRETILARLNGPVLTRNSRPTVSFTVSGTSPTFTVSVVPTKGAAVSLRAVDASSARLTAAGNVSIRTMPSRTSSINHFSYDRLEVAAIGPIPARPVTPVVPKPQTILSANYDTLANGAVPAARFRTQFPGAPTSAGAYKDMQVVPESGRGKVMRTLLRAGTIHTLPSGTSNGAGFTVPLRTAVDRACISYDLKFSAGFDFSLGGKLPGLQGSAPGYSAPAGGNPNATGWSGRMMWLGPKAYRWAGPVNMAVSYMYHPGQTSEYGDNVKWNKAFSTGVWHTVKQCYAMNTVGRSNGVLQTWLDGRLVVNRSDYVYRTRSDVHISQISWGIFRGGNTIAWAGRTDGYIYTDKVTVTKF